MPYNIFGEDVRDPDAPDFVNTDSVSHSKVTQQVVSGSLSGDFGAFMELPGGADRLRGRRGIPQRNQRLGARAGNPGRLELERAGHHRPPAASTSRKLFAEINVPVLKEAQFADRLSFGAAFRASDYSTVGQTNSWKVDTVYAPVQLGDASAAPTRRRCARRTSPSSSRRETTTFNFIVDPCDINETEQRHAARAKRIAPRC